MKKLLEDVVFFQEGPGVRNWQFKSEGIKLINIKNIVNDELLLENSNNYLSIDEVNLKYKHFLLNEGDFVMASSGVTWGKIAEIKKEHLPLCLNTSIIRLRVKNENVIDKWFLYYFIKSNKFKNQIKKLITGSAQPNFGPSHLKKVIIEYPDLIMQKKHVESLNIISGIIKNRQQQINKLDELIKSQFVDMFGNPLTSNNYERITLDKLTKVNQGLQIPISKRHNEGGKNRYKYITIQFLNGGKEAEYIENPNSRVVCTKDDILMTRTGNTGQVITNVEGVFHNNFFKVDYDKNKLNKEFLIKYFEDDGVYRDMIRRATTSTIPDLSHSEFYKMSIDLPPIELQNKFAEFVKQIDKQKIEIQKSLEETQNLQESLMDKCFG